MGTSPIKVLGNTNTLPKASLGTSNQKSLPRPSLQISTQSSDQANVSSWRASLHDSNSNSDSDTENQDPSLNSRFTTSTPTSNKAFGLSLDIA